MDRTTATDILIEAIKTYKEEHGIPLWLDDLVQIAEPGDEKWEVWQHNGSRMDGDPSTAEVALYCEGFGTYYGCTEAAVADIPSYFCEDLPQ